MTDRPEHIENTDLEHSVDQPMDIEGMSVYADQYADYEHVPSDMDETLEPLSEEVPPRISLSRIEKLTLAIERDPSQPSNYVFRGEAYLEKGQDDLAAVDFRTAIELAESQFDSANWGYIYSALIDRAREGLRRIEG